MSRGVYRVLLRLHPAAFRERFAAEMLWVFDQCPPSLAETVRDGVVSALTQWMANDPVPRIAVPFGLTPSSLLSGLRVAQATTVAALVTLGFLKLLTQSVPLPQQPRDYSQQRRAAWALCRVYRSGVVRHAGDPADCEAL